MILACLRPVGRAIQVLCGGSTPHEIALGLSLGLVLGLLPKSNLTAVLLCGLILSLRLNLVAASMAALTVMGFGPLLDSVAHQIGSFLLSWNVLQGGWAWFFRQPLVPWLRLDDTVVLGQLFIGVVLALPGYSLAVRVLNRVQPLATGIMRRSWPARLALGVRLPPERRAA